MTLTPPTSRKRSRSCEEEEFLPLSKKINNLHINNWGKVNSSQEQILTWTTNCTSNQLIDLCSGPNGCSVNPRRAMVNESRRVNITDSYNENSQPENHYNETELIRHYKDVANSEQYKNCSYGNGESSGSQNGIQNDWPLVYSPDLDINENPYYYESNKLLFDLYVERLQRNGY